MARNVVLAGGSHGIGYWVASEQMRLGNNVFAYSRTVGQLQALPEVQHQCHDFESESPLAELPERIDAALYCPGTVNLKSFASMKVADFQHDLDVNLLGAVRFLQQCLPGLKAAGSQESPATVVLFSTVAVSQGLTLHSSVAAAKGAVEAMGRSLAAEWAPNIRVNCIAPALTETPLTEQFFASDKARSKLESRYPLKRVGRADDMANVANFLLGEDSSWVTGQVFSIDGGMSTLS